MTQQTGGGVLGAHAQAIVGYADAAPSAFFDIDGDARRSGIERILDEFLDDGCRTLHNLACGDAICDVVWKNSNFRHVRSSESGYPNPLIVVRKPKKASR